MPTQRQARLLPAERRELLDTEYPVWTPSTLSQALDEAARRFPMRSFVITDQRSYTYLDIQHWSRRLAAGLVALSIQPGDHVATVVANYPEFVALKFAIARAGAVCVPINYLFRTAELGYVLEQSDTKLLITMDHHRDIDYLETLDQLVPGWERSPSERIPNLRDIVVFSPTGKGREHALTLAGLEARGTGEAAAEVARLEGMGDPKSYSDIIYTSGTTGSPKGVQLTHEQLLRMAYSAAYHRAFGDGRRQIFALPMYHVFGYVECMLAVMFVGGAIVPRVAFEAEDMLTAIARHRVNEIVAVPTMTLSLIDRAREGEYDLSSLESVFSSGGAAPNRIWDDIRSVLGPAEITTAYGMTETTAATTCVLPEGSAEQLRTTLGRLRDAGTAGDPKLGGHLATFKVVDVRTGEEVASGADGHLLVRGPAVTSGYYKKPDETADAFTSDGWLLTGDIGSIDSEGYLRLAGRLKESYRCGGEMVMPAEVEAVLEQHPEVLTAHVVGIRHPRMGEIGCAWIVARDAEHPPAPDELIQHCSSRLARFKVPRHILFTAAGEVPLTATLKVQKFRLQELAEERLSEQLTLA